MFQNLLSNAIKFIDKPKGKIEINSTKLQGYWEFRIADNGPGIAEAHLGRLFEPFFTTKPVGQGTGLGLSISYGIVERHGGKLSAANLPAGGVEFTLALPMERH